MFSDSINSVGRQRWLSQTLGRLPVGWRILDAGAGELQNKRHCQHLKYVSQDASFYDGTLWGGPEEGLQRKVWITSAVDIVSDVTRIPVPDSSFDAILCSEVLEHVPEPTRALDEFARLLRPGGKLILTAPFASVVHMAPHYFCTGFSRYWYEHHLGERGFRIEELSPNGDWFAYLRQELLRLGSSERRIGNWRWPLAYLISLAGLGYFAVRGKRTQPDLACFGFHCIATKA